MASSRLLFIYKSVVSNYKKNEESTINNICNFKFELYIK